MTQLKRLTDGSATRRADQGTDWTISQCALEATAFVARASLVTRHG